MDIDQHKFANLVTVFSKPTDDPSTFDVFWRSGLNKQGKTTVRVVADVGDKIVVAELSAMQHALEVLEVIGRNPTMSNLKLVFSSSAPKKLHLNKSTKGHLYPYAYFLTTRFKGAVVGVEQSAEWIKPRAENNLATLEVSEPLGEWMMMKGFGRVLVSKNLIERFSQKMNNIDAGKAWTMLEKLLSNASFSNIDAQKKLFDSEFAAGRIDRFTLTDAASRWSFVLVKDKFGRPTISTLFSG